MSTYRFNSSNYLNLIRDFLTSYLFNFSSIGRVADFASDCTSFFSLFRRWRNLFTWPVSSTRIHSRETTLKASAPFAS